MANNARIWDPIIRSFHWTVALAFLLNYFFLKEGSEPHEVAGYYILCALVVRFVWGFIGTQNARFTNFWPTPTKVRTHLKAVRQKNVPEENGHNPLGALMIFAMLGCLLLTGLSGWGMDGLTWGEDFFKGVHEVFANLTLLLVLIHVAAVVLFTITGPRDLIKQMITGQITRR